MWWCGLQLLVVVSSLAGGGEAMAPNWDFGSIIWHFAICDERRRWMMGRSNWPCLRADGLFLRGVVVVAFFTTASVINHWGME
uniref:Secreted protein n=1 Tax=Oryza glumipatula TaxID=40148 RepID=A0A0D9YNB0_9ORYZ